MLSTVGLADTIFAPATPPGQGAVAVIRLSGPASRTMASRLVAGGNLPGRGRLARRTIVHPETGAALDDGMVACFHAPDSHTGEDVVEFHLHGSPLLVSVLSRCLAALGGRRAEPGEFSLRAFLNGKEDLAQAEAVSDIVTARTEAGLSLAAAQLLDGSGGAPASAAGRVLALLARLEAELDFPDDVDELPGAELESELAGLSAALEELAGTYEAARVLKEGFRVVLAGPPNVGKSSLFNALLGRQRALVTEEPGTTRDWIEEYLPGTEVPVLLVDTAGLRDTASAAERAGVEAAHGQVARADLVLALHEAGSGNARSLPAAMPVATKTDLAADRTGAVHAVSSITGQGVAALREDLVCLATEAAAVPAGRVLCSERQRGAVQAAREALEHARRELPHLPRDILASLVRQALERLNEVTGCSPVSAQVLDSIFSRFCIGK